MTEIAPGKDLVTLVNVFMVAPENQQRLLEVLVEATQKVIRHMPGFISANFHRSLDGTRVLNYAQWRRREDLDAMLQHPDALPHLQEAARLATFEPRLHEVVHVDEAASGERA